MHPLQGKWKITAHSPLGDMPMVADMQVADSGTEFAGSVLDEKSGKSYPIENGVIDGNKIFYSIAMKFGLISLTFKLEGEFFEDNTCSGVARAMKMEGNYEGYKL